MNPAVQRQQAFYKWGACAPPQPRFDFSLRSKRRSLSGGAGASSQTEREAGGRGEKEKKNSQVTKTRHTPDKLLYHITTQHHTENNALFF